MRLRPGTHGIGDGDGGGDGGVPHPPTVPGHLGLTTTGRYVTLPINRTPKVELSQQSARRELRWLYYSTS